jgi:hypothetical protein
MKFHMLSLLSSMQGAGNAQPSTLTTFGGETGMEK